MAKPPGKCIFCGQFGLSKEHIIPNWVRQLIPRGANDHHLFTIARDIPAKKNQTPHIRSKYVRQGHPGTKQVRRVCKKCNEGWLSTLEDELKPVLKELISGSSLVLTPWMQRRLATWATKTAMTAEFIDPKSAAIVFAQRDYLRLHRDPPQEFNVWAGFYTSNKYSSSLYHHSGYFSYETKIYKKGSTSLNTQATVIIVGRLFLQVASCAIPDAQFRLKNEEASRPRRIWPPSDSDIDWPPPQAIGNDELDIILMGLHRAFEATD